MVDGISGTTTVYTPPTVGTPEFDAFLKNINEKLLTIIQGGGNQTVGEGDGANKPRLDAPGMSGLEVADILAGLKSKINEVMEGVSKEKIEDTKLSEKQESQERIKQLQKALESMRSASKWGVLGKILGWALPALMIVVGAALVATGVGAAVGAMLIAGGIVGLGAQILQETGAAEEIMKGLSKMFEAFGMSKEQAQMAAMITYTVAITAIMIAASCGAGSAVSASAQAASAAVKLSVSLVQAAGSVAQAGVALGEADARADAMDHQAKAEEINAVIKKLQMKLEEEMQQLQEIAESWQKGMDIVMGVIDSQNQAAQMSLKV